MFLTLNSGLLLSLLSVTQFAPGSSMQQLDPNMMKELAKSYKEDKRSSYDQSYILKNHRLQDSSLTDPDKSDSINDSLSQNGKLVKQSSSTYEKLIRGENVNPDSILSSLSMFGYDLFEKSRPSTFAPTDFSSVPADYPINVSDEIIVNLWGRINEEYRLRVSREGTISIPRIGPVSVAGLPFETMRKNIIDKVGKIEGVNASVSMGELRTIGVYIVGEVISPGYYTISALSNITNALFAAGGPTKNGSLRNIQLKRNGRLISSVDFYDFLLSGSDRSGFRLQPGDVIHVPIITSMAAVAGNVRRSALYELKDATKLEDLIKTAGGITPAAWTNKIQVERFSNNQYRVILDLDSAQGKLPEFLIQDGDIVKVFPVLNKDKNTIYLSGNVLRPGKYEFKEGMRVCDLITDFRSLLPETHFEYAIVLRQEPPSFLNRIIAFNLKNAFDLPESEDNLFLQEHDQIVIYHRDFFEPDRSVSIEGAVTNPGKYKLLNNMKIRDLILQAGGLKEEASPIKGELYRRLSKNENIMIDKKDFCVECAMQNDLQYNIELQKSDRIFIRSKKGWEEERKVTLKGQFVYPGTYVIFDGETLGDLIKRAGGFKEDAYLAAAVFTRSSVKALEKRRLREYSNQLESDILKLSAELATSVGARDAQDILSQQMAMKEKVDSLDGYGRVVIDLRKEESYKDFALEDNDELHVPRNLNTVSVIGEVYNPATFKYDISNRRVSHYLNAAGGMKKETSDKKQVYVIKADGSIITNKSTNVVSSNIEPGDVVVVPQKIRYTNPHRRFVDTADALFKITTFLATLATLLVTASKL